MTSVFQAGSLSPEECERHLAEVLPASLPSAWRLDARALDGARYVCKDGLQVIVSVDRERDGKVWLHVSLSRQKRLPTYTDMVLVKSLFVGAQRKAIQVFAPASQHINIHPFCLHLFACLEGDPLPDFTQGSGSI